MLRDRLQICIPVLIELENEVMIIDKRTNIHKRILSFLSLYLNKTRNIPIIVYITALAPTVGISREKITDEAIGMIIIRGI